MSQVGQFLKEARIKAGLTLTELQRKHGIDAAYISNVEAGRKRISSLKYFGKLAVIYNISYEEFHDKIFIPEIMEEAMPKKKKPKKPKY